MPDLARSIVLRARGLVERDGIFHSIRRSPVSWDESGSHQSQQLEKDSFWFDHRARCITELISQRPPPVPVIFDVGGGNGLISRHIVKAGMESVVVEPMIAGAKNAKQQGTGIVVCAAFNEANFETDSLPAVGLFDVLEHVENDVDFLREIVPALIAGGRVYLTVPAHHILWSVYDDVAGHRRRYTRRSLAATLGEAGLACDFISYFFWFLPLPLLLGRALPSRLGWFGKSVTVEYARHEHRAGMSWVRRFIDLLCTAESHFLRRGHTLALGASCLAAARKKE